MGAYGSPELGPLRAPRVDDAVHSAGHRSWPARVILWSLATVAASFAAMIVLAIILGTIEAVRAAH